MKYFITLAVLVFSSFVHARGVTIEWKCPDNSVITPINILYNDNGRMVFIPEIFNKEIKGVTVNQLQTCIDKFQTDVRKTIAAFKQQNCPASKDDFCFSSLEYSQVKLWEKIKSSNALKKFPSIVLTKPAALDESNLSAPKTPQSYLEDKIAKKEIDPKDLGENFYFQGNQYRVGDFDQVVSQNIRNVFTNMSTEEARQYAQNYMVMNSAHLNSPSQSPKRTAVLNNLNKMFGYIYGDRGPEELAKLLECKPEDNLQPIQDILENLEESNKVAKCNELKPGEHKVYEKEHSDYYRTGNYLLRKDPAGNYRVSVSINFKQGSGSVTPAEMLERTKNCFNLAADSLKGPAGEKMLIDVLSPTEVSELPKDMRPKPNDVTVEGPDFDTNAASYAEDVKCGTIAHEVLHLLGLCDEYKEDRPQYAQYNWTCRVVTSVPSIMRDTSVFEKAVGETKVCDCNTDTCRAIMNGSDPNLKSLYTTRGFYSLTDHVFRNKYCKSDTLPSNSSMNIPQPSKNILVSKSSDSEVEVENRFVTSMSKAPFFLIARNKISCKCPANDVSCQGELKRLSAMMDNPGVNSNCPMGAAYNFGPKPSKSKGVHFENNQLVLVSNPILPSLLQPNHFYKILEGNCPGGKSATYQECADFAYKGEPCHVPENCKNDSYYLGSPQ